MRLSDLIPGLQGFMRSLGNVWPAPLIKSTNGAFQIIQSVHLVALAALGGCIILMGLRLAGFGMTRVSLRSMEKSTRYLLWGAIATLVVTGIVMGLLIAPRLYARPAFLAKMIGLAAALIMSFAVVPMIARADGVVTQAARIWSALAVALWLWATWVFGWSQGSAPGTFHVVAAGWLLAMGLGSARSRIALGAITALVVLGVGYVTYFVYTPGNDYDIVMEINRWTVRLSALVVAGFIAWEFRAPQLASQGEPDIGAKSRLARMLGIFTIIAWVTVAAAGRWIGLGGDGG